MRTQKLWRSRGTLSYRFRLYSSKAVGRVLLERLELCRWLYNRLLDEMNRAEKENKSLTKNTQAPIATIKKAERR